MREQLSEIQYLAFCPPLVNGNSTPVISSKHFPSASHPNLCCTENIHSAPDYDNSLCGSLQLTALLLSLIPDQPFVTNVYMCVLHICFCRSS